MAENRPCPYCAEEIRADAIRCKHCHSAIPPQKLDHGGICPLCKEEIKVEAIRCKHCKADLTQATASGTPSATLAPFALTIPSTAGDFAITEQQAAPRIAREHRFLTQRGVAVAGETKGAKMTSESTPESTSNNTPVSTMVGTGTNWPENDTKPDTEIDYRTDYQTDYRTDYRDDSV